MFLVAGTAFLILLSMTLIMLWGHEKVANKKIIPRAKIEESWNGEDRRQHLRFKKALIIEYKVEKKPHLKNAKTIDISKGGLKLLLDEKLKEGSILDLKVGVPGANKVIEIEGEVVWTRDAEIKDFSGKRFFRSGIKYITIKEPHGTHLSEYLASLESQNI